MCPRLQQIGAERHAILSETSSAAQSMLILPSDDIGAAGGVVFSDSAPKCLAMDAAHMVRYQYRLKRILMIDDACIMCINHHLPRPAGRYKAKSAT